MANVRTFVGNPPLISIIVLASCYSRRVFASPSVYETMAQQAAMYLAFSSDICSTCGDGYSKLY